MTAQKRHSNNRLPIDDGVPRHLPHSASGALFAAALMGCVMTSVGCKTGSSFTKPSWWTLGGTPKADADALAAAPPYGGDIKKPSESAKPYPTTSTPSGYVITGTGSPTDAVAQQFQSAQPQAPVVYGSTPPPQPALAASTASPPSGGFAQQPAASSIAPQVGPYAALAGDTIPPPGQPLPPISPSNAPAMGGMTSMNSMPSMPSGPATPAEATLPTTAYSNFSAPSASAVNQAPPAPRMADARAADPAAAIPAAALPVEQPAYGGARYSASNGSRFAGASSFEPAAAAPQATNTPAYTSPYATPAAAGFAAPPAAAPMGVAPAVEPSVAPTTPGLLQPPVQPVRRPDPVYRPGGTSSYRPSRTILADESSPAAAVRTASYEEPTGTIQQ
jgi:hypothetical protein